MSYKEEKIIFDYDTIKRIEREMKDLLTKEQSPRDKTPKTSTPKSSSKKSDNGEEGSGKFSKFLTKR